MLSPSPVHCAVALLAVSGFAAPALADNGPASPQVISGDAQAAGPDIITVGQQKVILLGIDAPEPDQTCMDGGQAWRCGDTAFAVLDQIVKSGKVSCTLYGRPDPFRRYGGVCTVDGKDVAGELVAQGLALVYKVDKQSAQYVAAQAQAKQAHAGLWKQGVTFQDPWDYRAAQHPGGFK